jgi:uncharacterized YigZ family protein
MSYRAPAGPARFEQEIKKSRFIGIAIPAATTEEVSSALAAIGREFPDATHVAWAYLLGNPEDGPKMRADDAGEPAGTAGKPILNVLQRRAVGDVLLAVVRYFGGVKLGAGGLARAYSGAASGAIDRVELRAVTPRADLRLRIGYPDEQSARRLFAERGVEIVSVEFGDAVVLTVRAPKDDLSSLVGELSERTSGRAAVVPAADAI